MKKVVLILLVTISVWSCKKKQTMETEAQTEPEPASKGSIEVVDQKLENVLDTKAPIEVLAEGYSWSEGPLWLPNQEMLIFSDVPKNTIYSWSEEKGAGVYLTPSGFTGEKFEGSEPGSNGLTLNNQGELVLCQHGNRAVSVMKADLSEPMPNYEYLAETFEGKRFNSPNDLIFDRAGNLYFTDPPYGLPGGMEDAGKEIDFQGVYRVTPEGEVTLLTDELTRPNGLALSPDEKTLYVANSDPEKAIWMAYELGDAGKIRSKKVLYNVTEWVPKAPGLPDGLKVDNQGNLFATGPGGVWIFSPEGAHLGTIKTGEATANCAFNDDKTSLYMTADSFLLRLKLK
jgi:gluconolactonase